MKKHQFHKQPTLTGVAPSTEPAGNLPPQIGPYKIESLLSKGGMSLLYLGLHPVTRELIAIKVLSPQFVTHPEMVSRFLKESKIIGMTDHPNIVKLYGEGEWEKGLYIAMEFIRGVSLRQFIEQHSLSMKRCIDIILQVAYALTHLHSHGVIHGDLKPENILITEGGEVKVIDFGIAKLHEEIKKGKSYELSGTPTYMSPEQKEDPSKITFASDLYALGIIAYELFSGKLSFGIVHLSQVPKGLRQILEKALAVSLKERYSTAIDFISDLSEYLKTGGLERDRPGTDQLKEIFETIQRATQSLSPPTLPAWPALDLGVAKFKVARQDQLYHDFFKFHDDSMGVVIAEPLQNRLEGSVFIANLRGTIRALIASQEKLSFTTLTTQLQRIIRDDPLQNRFKISFLRLSSAKDELNFLSCGFGNLLHLPSGNQTPRLLTNNHPPLGADGRADLEMTIDNWNIGDIVIFHTCDPSHEAPIQEGLKEHLYLSPQSQADAILKKVTPSLSLEKKSALLFSFHRIG